MKIINDGYPEDIYVAMWDNGYTKGESDYSITELLRPPQMLALERMYENRLRRTATDSVRLFSGNCFHDYMEASNKRNFPDAIIEQRFTIQVFDKLISGKIDFFNAGVLADYKETSVWKFVKGDFDDWARQLNTYAFLLEHSGVMVDELVVRAKFYDWKQNEKMRSGKDYPNKPIVEIPIKLMFWQEQKDLLYQLVKSHSEAEELNPKGLWACCPCTEKDMWQSPTTFAVMKGKNKRATRVFDDYDDAVAYCSDDAFKTYHIVERLGKRTRCESYCSVAAYCQQYQDYLGGE